MAIRSVILGVGASAPERIVTNYDLEKLMDTSHDWIIQRTGISERRMVDEGGKWSDFVVPGCLMAMERAGVKAEELDMVIAGTMTADMMMPSGGCTIQSLIGAKNAVAFSLSAACSGFIYGLTVADRFIRTEPDMKILVIGADLISQRLDWEDRSTAILFGDGGGAAVLTGREGERGILSTRMYSDGDLWDLLYVSGGGTLDPAFNEASIKPHAIKMKGNELFKVAVKSMGQACLNALEEAGVKAEDIDLVVPHQANLRIINKVISRLGLDMEKVIINVDKYGNTSAGTIPLALNDAYEAGRIKEGDLVLMPVFGGGLTWGATLLRW